MESPRFEGHALPCLIGSLPLTDYREAADWVERFTPEIPLWVQLPRLPGEMITQQFAAGLPGLREAEGRVFVDTEAEGFPGELESFYAEVLDIEEGGRDLEGSRFALRPEAAGGFFELERRASSWTKPPSAVKGQIIGPVTFGTSFTDGRGRPIFYDPSLREALLQLLALRARWQVRRLSALAPRVLLFFDDPAITAFGSSQHIGLAREEIAQGLAAVIAAVHREGGLAGVHICANADWTLVLDSEADIVSFDAYSFFDRFVIYADPIRRFLARGGVIAWGIVPTLHPEDLARETVASLAACFRDQLGRVGALGVSPSRLLAQSLITPACGMGTLPRELAWRGLELTRGLSERIRGAEGAGGAIREVPA